MSRSGTYKYNPETGKVEKVSDRVPSLNHVFDLYFPGAGRFDHLSHRPVYLESKRQLRNELQSRGLTQTVRMDKKEI